MSPYYLSVLQITTASHRIKQNRSEKLNEFDDQTFHSESESTKATVTVQTNNNNSM
jgi:hypothetical protein